MTPMGQFSTARDRRSSECRSKRLELSWIKAPDLRFACRISAAIGRTLKNFSFGAAVILVLSSKRVRGAAPLNNNEEEGT